MNERYTLDEIDTTEFARDFAAIAAKQMRKVPREEWALAMVKLMDNTSLYAPLTYDFLKAELSAHPDPAVERVAKQFGLDRE